MTGAGPVVRPVTEALDDVQSWLETHDVPVTGPLEAVLLTGGRSHLTYLVTDAEGHRLVLRVPPAAAAGAHDIEREHFILAALDRTAVPTPRPVALCTDPSVLGGPFSVVEHVVGRVLTTPEDGAELTLAARATATRAIVDVLADIHRLDPAALGLDPEGRGATYLERQVGRWTRMSESAAGPGAEPLRSTAKALGARVPVQRSTVLVHGDYKFANVMVRSNGSLVSVLDWELAAAGDPLCDLGALLAMWPDPGELALFESPTSTVGFGTRAEVVAAYAARTRADLSGVGWYHAFALWRIACLLSAVTERYRVGVMGADGFDLEHNERLVGRLAERAGELL